MFGLDLRHTPSVEAFCHELIGKLPRLDFIINNACQTVRRPPEFYAHMMEAETAALHDTPGRRAQVAGQLRRPAQLQHAAGRPTPSAMQVAIGGISETAGLTRPAELSQVPLLAEELLAQKHLFPEGRLDQDLQQVDLRGRNSWRLLMHEVPSVELLETQLVNAIAPFIINARLKPLMLRTPERDKHIVNVSAVEGQFYRNFKTTRHPHTNMAKAALNMMTRTAAADYHGDGIHMNTRRHRLGHRRGSGRARRAQGDRGTLPPAAGHRRRRRAHRRSDHPRPQHRRARLGPVPEGLQADGLVRRRVLRGSAHARHWLHVILHRTI